MKTELFISRDEPGKFFKHLWDTGQIELQCFACVDLVFDPDGPAPEADWIFFSSPAAVAFFCDHYSLGRSRIAAIGQGTAHHLELRGIRLDFVPQASEPGAAAQEFGAVVQEGYRVLVPQSNLTRHRLRDVIPPHQLIEWRLYTNQPRTLERPARAKVLIFTSPSNAQSYLSQFSIDDGQRVVAIGESTAEALRHLGITRMVTASDPSEEALWEAAQKVR